MVVIALLLLAVVVAVVVFVVVTGSTGTVTLEWDQLNLFFEPSPLVLFLLGAVTLLLAVAAIAMLRAGSRRSMAKRRELKRLRRLEDEHSRQGTGAPDAAPTGTLPGTARPEANHVDATRTHRSRTDGPRTEGQQRVTATETRAVRPDDGQGTR